MTVVVGITMVKDEADIVAATVTNIAHHVDHVIVADNMSTDATRSILDGLAVALGNITVVDDFDPAYQQSAKMTALALRARLEHGADWIVPFDADEIWYTPFAERIGDMLADVAPQWLVVPATLYDHVATGRDDADPNPVLRLGWRRSTPAPLPKVACRWRDDLIIEMGNHAATYRGGSTRFEPWLVVRHFPYRSVEQLIRKVRNGAAAYRLTDHGPAVGTHWRQWGELLETHGEPAIAELFHTWYFQQDPSSPVAVGDPPTVLPPLLFDPAPHRS